MPCSECHIAGHTRPKCPQISTKRALSIMNNRVDPGHNNSIMPEWFKDTNEKYPIELEWKHSYIQYPGAVGRNMNTTIQMLYKLRWLIKDIPILGSSDRTPISKLLQNIGGLWYSYTYDRERKLIRESLYSDELTGNPIADNVAKQESIVINQRINTYIAREHKIEREARINESRARLINEHNARERQEYQRERRERRERERHERHEREREAMQAYEANFASLPKPALKAIDCNECPICMDPLENTNIVILRCGHKTCGDCIFNHFQRAGGCSCPQCRTEFTIRIPGWKPPQLV